MRATPRPIATSTPWPLSRVPSLFARGYHNASSSGTSSDQDRHEVMRRHRPLARYQWNSSRTESHEPDDERINPWSPHSQHAHERPVARSYPLCAHARRHRASSTGVLPEVPHFNSCKRVPNRPLWGRRGRFGTLLQLLECDIFERTAVCIEIPRSPVAQNHQLHCNCISLLDTWRFIVSDALPSGVVGGGNHAPRRHHARRCVRDGLSSIRL